MPHRSNQFQRLVARVHAQLGVGWTVQESRMLRDIRTEALREVDITAENVVAGYPVIISIEVRDRGRAADVAWVEEMAQKHADLPTSKLALWSATGFSAQATRKAGALSVALVTPDDLETAPLASLARNVMGGSVKMVQIRFEAVADVRLDDGSMERWPVSFATLIEPVGGDTGLGLPVGWFVSVLEKDPELRSDVLTQAPLGRGDFFAVYEPPIPAIVRHEDGRIGALSRL